MAKDFLKNRTAIVLGGGRGIGRGIALLMASYGANIVVVDPGLALDGSPRNEGEKDPADQVLKEIEKAGGNAVRSDESILTVDGSSKIVQCALDNFSGLDIVVTSQGILRDRMIYNMSEDEWDAVIDVHLKGTFSIIKCAAAYFREQKYGRIITVSSESGLVGNPGQANYGAAKSGIAGLTKVVARDLGRFGVTANSIVPRAWTRMTENVPMAEKMKTSGIPSREEFEKWMPDDIAPFAVFLATDYASDVNGQVFLVYGGTVALMSQPRPINTIYRGAGLWTVDELSRLLPNTLCKDMSNPGQAS